MISLLCVVVKTRNKNLYDRYKSLLPDESHCRSFHSIPRSLPQIKVRSFKRYTCGEASGARRGYRTSSLVIRATDGFEEFFADCGALATLALRDRKRSNMAIAERCHSGMLTFIDDLGC